jgi:hypothetical protein
MEYSKYTLKEKSGDDNLMLKAKVVYNTKIYICNTSHKNGYAKYSLLFGHILVHSSDTDGYLCMECLKVTIIWHTTLYCTVQYCIFRPTVVNCFCSYTVRKGGVTGECACLTLNNIFLYRIDIYEYVCTLYKLLYYCIIQYIKLTHCPWARITCKIEKRSTLL